MLSTFEKWLFQNALGKAVVVVVQAAVSAVMANSGILGAYGVTVGVNPNVAAAGLLALLHTLWSRIEDHINAANPPAPAGAAAPAPAPDLSTAFIDPTRKPTALTP